MKSRSFPVCALLLAIAVATSPAHALDTEVNLYSARHYQTDEALYRNFEKQTGIKVNRIEAKEDELLERIRNEGAASPADVFITVDASRLAKADELGLLAPVKSKLLESRIPAQLRSHNWLAFSTRARVIVYNKASLKAGDLGNYEDLALPRLKGQVCMRSGSHPYNVSLMASLIQHLGASNAEAWARGVAANFARSPKGGDTDQILAVAAGECGVTIANTYYLARLMRSTKEQDRKAVEQIGIVWPNQQRHGTHTNISGGGVLRSAPHKAAAVKFLEYLASDQAQIYFADGNNEWPVVATVGVSNPALAAMGKFKADPLPISTLAKNVTEAQKIFDRVGWR